MKKIGLVILLVSFLPATQFAQFITGTVASYSFNNGNANDETGTNNGTVVGATLTSDRFGNPNHAYYFNGLPNCYINFGTSTVLKPVNGSISLWARADALSISGSGYSHNPVLLTKNQSGNNCFEAYFLFFTESNGYPQFAITTTQPFCNQQGIFSNAAVNYQQWYHLVLTWDSSNVAFYLNSVLQGQMNKGYNSVYYSPDSVMMANSANIQNNRFFLGAIDDLAIFDYVTTQKEIDALYYMSDPLASIGDNSDNSSLISLYPNPVNTGQLFLNNLPANQEAQIQIFNVTGQLVMEDRSKNILDIEKLEPGLYLLRYASEKIIVTRRFIIE